MNRHMVMAYAVDAAADQQSTLQTKEIRPPHPPRGLAAVLLDEFDVGSELVVAVDTDDVMTVQLHAAGLDASGAAHAATWRFQNQSVFALADIAVVGYDAIAERSVNGKINIGLTWRPADKNQSIEVAGTALAEGTWTGGLFRFNTVSRHSFNRKVIRLVSTQPFPSSVRRYTDRRHRLGGDQVFRLGSDS